MIGSWFGTAYDEPRSVLELPVEVSSGTEDEVCVVDQVARGTGIVGRVLGDFGAVALRVQTPGYPVQVGIDLQLDELGTRWWSDRISPPRMQPERPRVVLLRVQGAIRGAAVLARKQGWRGAQSAHARFDLPLAAGELDGLLVVELAEPTLPSWTAQRISERSALGLRIDTISVRESPSTMRQSPAWTGCDLAVLQPGDPAAFRLEIGRTALAPPVPRSPANIVTRRKPTRAVSKGLRIARRGAVVARSQVAPARPGSAPGVLAADLVSGVPMPVEIVKRSAGGLELRLAAPPEGPVLIGLDRARPGLSCRIVPLP